MRTAVLILLCALPTSLGAGARQPLPDSYLDAMQLLERKGYHGEEHQVLTEDGYVLTVHRIPRGRTSSATPGPPVLLQHGVFGASDYWLLTPPDKSLAFILADRGYDVWLGNVRGNCYARKHLNMSAEEPAFWDFSFQEHGLYDLAAMLDYVLEKSGRPHVFYVGHSMGATMFYVLTSLRPQYGAKVRLMVALAPAVFLPHVRLPGLQLLVQHHHAISRLLDRLGVRELLPRTEMIPKMAENLCTDHSPLQPFCVTLFVLLYGDDLPQLNKTALPVYFSHLIAGGSKKTLAHFAQIVATGRFQQYDYGSRENLRRYRSKKPPDYPLHKVTTPCSLHYGEGDLLITPADVTQLRNRLPRALGPFKVPHSRFNHIDFVLAIDVDKLVYDQLLDIMATF